MPSGVYGPSGFPASQYAEGNWDWRPGGDLPVAAPEVAFEPMDPYAMPATPFDSLVQAYGVRVLWQKSHTCPCAWAGASPTSFAPVGIPGSAKQTCLQCGGLGVYWDTPYGPFPAVVSFIHGRGVSQDEPGQGVDPRWGQVAHWEPTIGVTWGLGGMAWQQMSEYDLFTTIDVQLRFNSVLYDDGVHNWLPYRQNLSVAAATQWDSATNMVSAVPFTVSGAQVLLQTQELDSAPYVVEYYASPSYVAFRSAGGMMHARPFGQNQTPLPRRMRLSALDLWLRQGNFPAPMAGMG